MFSVSQFCEWFDLTHITPSSAQFNTEKLKWINAHYIKQTESRLLSVDISKRLALLGVNVNDVEHLVNVIELYKDRAQTLNELASAVLYFYSPPETNEEAKQKHITEDIIPIIQEFADALSECEWSVTTIHDIMQSTVTKHAIKFPKLAMPLRVMLTGNAQSPSIDAVIFWLGRDLSLSRIRSFI